MSSPLMENTRVKHYILVEKIGSGSFASVWLGRHIITNAKVAIKVIEKRSEQSNNRFQSEVSILGDTSHPFIIGFFESFEYDHKLFLILEFAKKGSLKSSISGFSFVPENVIRKYFVQITEAILYLHTTLKIAHRDLKPENILIDAHGNIRISDFGLSDRFTDQNPTLHTKCGSPAYAAPEMISGTAYTKAVDIWSLGIVFYYLACRQLPFQESSSERLAYRIVNSEIPYPSSISPMLKDLLEKMLCKNPLTRITAQDILEHPWCKVNDMTTIAGNMIAEYRRLDGVISESIIQKLSELGMDVTALEDQLAEKQRTDLTSVYAQLCREEMTKAIALSARTKASSYAGIPLLQREPKVTFKEPETTLQHRPSAVFAPKQPMVVGTRILNVPPPVMITPRRMSKPGETRSRNLFDFGAKKSSRSYDSKYPHSK